MHKKLISQGTMHRSMHESIYPGTERMEGGGDKLGNCPQAIRVGR